MVAPLQCMKKEIFSDNAKRFGFEETKFLEGEGQGKVLTPQKLMEVLSYVFKKEDVRSFWI